MRRRGIQMRVCLALKGTFSVNDVRQGNDTSEKYIQNLMKSIESVKKSLIEPFTSDGHTVDVFCSSYDTAFVPIIEKNYQPKRFFKFPKEEINNGGDWNRQLFHYMKVIDEIRQYEDEVKQTYDIYIFTRYDLLFLGTLKEWNINLEKFNIAMKHSSGNCDDNIWVFPKQYFTDFSTAIFRIYNLQDTPHTLNHRLLENNVPIHYIYEITEEDYKNNTCYKIYAFNRNG